MHMLESLRHQHPQQAVKEFLYRMAVFQPKIWFVRVN